MKIMSDEKLFDGKIIWSLRDLREAKYGVSVIFTFYIFFIINRKKNVKLVKKVSSHISPKLSS